MQHKLDDVRLTFAAIVAHDNANKLPVQCAHVAAYYWFRHCRASSPGMRVVFGQRYCKAKQASGSLNND